MFDRATKPRPSMAEHSFDRWCSLVEARCGLSLGPSKKAFLERRLWPLMLIAGIQDYGLYLSRIDAGHGDWETIQESLLNHETRFFRHSPSFEALARHVLPALFEDRQRAHLNMWSAGCSTGEELYSMGMCALAHPETAAREARLQLLGTDLGNDVLRAAAAGWYSSRRCEAIPRHHRARFLQTKPAQGRRRIVDKLRRAARFQRWNLRHHPWQIPRQDVVFCQNLLIYLPPQLRLSTVERLVERLNVGGFLVLAPAEMVFLRVDSIERVDLPECSIFRRAR